MSSLEQGTGERTRAGIKGKLTGVTGRISINVLARGTGPIREFRQSSKKTRGKREC